MTVDIPPRSEVAEKLPAFEGGSLAPQTLNVGSQSIARRSPVTARASLAADKTGKIRKTRFDGNIILLGCGAPFGMATRKEASP
jgi:hypothetical protein